MKTCFRKTCMNKSCALVFPQLLVTGVLFFCLSPAVIAKESAQTSLVNSSASTNSMLQTKQWANWVLSQVRSLPSIKAKGLEISVADEQRNAMRQPLYNPELSISYTNKDDDEYSLAVSQTIDWYDKRLASSSLGQVNYELTTINKQLVMEKKLAEALFAYVDYSTEKQLLGVTKQQEVILNKISADIKIRAELGDVGAIDAEMAYLSLSQNLQQISLREIRYRKSIASLEEKLNSQEIPFEPGLSIWNNRIAETEFEQYLIQGLKTQVAQKQLNQSQALSKMALLNKKSNPTFGLGAGREGSENTLSLEFSIPLNVRNSFSAEYRASLKKITQSELELAEEKRLLEKQIRPSFDNYIELRKRVSKWKKLTNERVKGSKKIITKLWQGGDMTTSDYLFSLQQRSDSLISNIELTAEMQKAWIEWLVLTSQVESWMKSL